MAHAPLAPSAAHRWMECPGSAHLCAGIEDDESIYAAEGTFAHAVAADCLRMREGRDYLEEKRGSTSECGRFTVDDDMVEHLRAYIDAVEGTLTLEGGELFVEKRVDVSPELWGTADAIIWNDTELHVFDLKYGAGIWVPVEDNQQLLIYAVATLCSHALRAKNILTIHMHVVQPRHYSEGPAWRTSTVTRAWLDAWFQQVLVSAVQATGKPDAPLIPGDHQCRFCPAKHICPALRAASMQRVQAAFEAPVKTEPAAMTAEQLGKALDSFRLVDEWMHAVRQHAYELVEKQGVQIPGWKLVKKQAHRKWVDEHQAEQVLKDCGIDPLDRKLVSPAEAERRLGRSKKVVQGLTMTPDIGTALVPQSDRRPAWTPGAVFPVDDKKDVR